MPSFDSRNKEEDAVTRIMKDTQGDQRKVSRRALMLRAAWCLVFLMALVTFPFEKVMRMRSHAAPKKTRSARKRTGPIVRSVVAIEPCASYKPDVVFRSLQKAIQAINFIVPRGKSVLLKPNVIAQNTPDQATTTHPSIIDAACRLFSDHGCAVTIGDSSAFYQGGGTREGLETSGLADVARKYGARLLPFEATSLRKITGGKYLDPLYLTDAVFDHDLVVNMPKLKLHRLARYTGAIKNMYGCIPGGTKQIYHTLYQHRYDYQDYWGKPVVEVYNAVNPGLTIMDAIIGLDRDGPAANGEPRFTGLLLASRNGAALDVVACKIIGFDPEWVPAVREALKRGLASLEGITVRGNVPSIPYTRLPDVTPLAGIRRSIDDYVFGQFLVAPRIRLSACTRCDACINRCAAGAIRHDNRGLPVIDYNACIHCYCCPEYCGPGAISLHGSAVNLIMRGVRQLFKL